MSCICVKRICAFRAGQHKPTVTKHAQCVDLPSYKYQPAVCRPAVPSRAIESRPMSTLQTDLRKPGSGVLPYVQVNGDAFIGRTYDNGDDFRRLDFKVSEVSSDAAWVQVLPIPFDFAKPQLTLSDSFLTSLVGLFPGQPCGMFAGATHSIIDHLHLRCPCLPATFGATATFCVVVTPPCDLYMQSGWSQWQFDVSLVLTWYCQPNSQEARAQNERKRQRDSPAALESRMRGSQPASMSEAAPQPSPSKPLSTAEALKEQGNAALKQGNLQQVKQRRFPHAPARPPRLHHSFLTLLYGIQHNCITALAHCCMLSVSIVHVFITTYLTLATVGLQLSWSLVCCLTTAAKATCSWPDRHGVGCRRLHTGSQ